MSRCRILLNSILHKLGVKGGIRSYFSCWKNALALILERWLLERYSEEEQKIICDFFYNLDVWAFLLGWEITKLAHSGSVVYIKEGERPLIDYTVLVFKKVRPHWAQLKDVTRLSWAPSSHHPLNRLFNYFLILGLTSFVVLSFICCFAAGLVTTNARASPKLVRGNPISLPTGLYPYCFNSLACQNKNTPVGTYTPPPFRFKGTGLRRKLALRPSIPSNVAKRTPPHLDFSRLYAEALKQEKYYARLYTLYFETWGKAFDLKSNFSKEEKCPVEDSGGGCPPREFKEGGIDTIGLGVINNLLQRSLKITDTKITKYQTPPVLRGTGLGKLGSYFRLTLLELSKKSTPLASRILRAILNRLGWVENYLTSLALDLWGLIGALVKNFTSILRVSFKTPPHPNLWAPVLPTCGYGLSFNTTPCNKSYRLRPLVRVFFRWWVSVTSPLGLTRLQPPIPPQKLAMLLAGDILWRSGSSRVVTKGGPSLLAIPFMALAFYTCSRWLSEPTGLLRRSAPLLDLGPNLPLKKTPISSSTDQVPYLYPLIDSPLIWGQQLAFFLEGKDLTGALAPVKALVPGRGVSYYLRFALTWATLLAFALPAMAIAFPGFFWNRALLDFACTPIKSLRGLWAGPKGLPKGATPIEYPHLKGRGGVSPWVKAPWLRWLEKKTLWVWSFKNLGSRTSYGYSFSNSYTNGITKPFFLSPVWSPHLKGRYGAYGGPLPIRNSRTAPIWAMLIDSVFRAPSSLRKAIGHRGFSSCDDITEYTGFRALKNREILFYSTGTPPLKSLAQAGPRNLWYTICDGWKKAGWGSFLIMIDTLVSKTPANITYLWKHYIVNSTRVFLKTIYSVNQGVLFNTKKYFSYFLWKNTHPFNKLSTTSTKFLQPPHWGVLRPPLSLMGILKQGLLFMRIIFIGYRFKLKLLPFFKAHLWLYYLYPLTTVMGVYPSFIEPNHLFFDMGGGSNFATLTYRLIRAIKVATWKTLWGGYNYTKNNNEALNEAILLTLNSQAPLGVAENTGFDTCYGFGGYWGHEQSSGLVDRVDTVRPLFRVFETPGGLSSPSTFLNSLPHPLNHPVAPTAPNFEKSLGSFNDRFYSRPRVYRHPSGVRKHTKQRRNLGDESNLNLYEAHRNRPSTYLRLEEEVGSILKNGPRKGGNGSRPSRHSQPNNPPQKEFTNNWGKNRENSSFSDTIRIHERGLKDWELTNSPLSLKTYRGENLYGGVVERNSYDALEGADPSTLQRWGGFKHVSDSGLSKTRIRISTEGADKEPNLGLLPKNRGGPGLGPYEGMTNPSRVTDAGLPEPYGLTLDELGGPAANSGNVERMAAIDNIHWTSPDFLNFRLKSTNPGWSSPFSNQDPLFEVGRTAKEINTNHWTSPGFSYPDSQYVVPQLNYSWDWGLEYPIVRKMEMSPGFLIGYERPEADYLYATHQGRYTPPELFPPEPYAAQKEGLGLSSTFSETYASEPDLSSVDLSIVDFLDSKDLEGPTPRSLFRLLFPEFTDPTAEPHPSSLEKRRYSINDWMGSNDLKKYEVKVPLKDSKPSNLEVGFRGRVDLACSPNLRSRTNPAHNYVEAPYNTSRRSTLFQRHEEGLLLRGPKPSSPSKLSLSTPSEKLAKFYDRYSASPTNSLALKDGKKRGQVFHHEVHPNLTSYWKKDGLRGEASIESFLGPKNFSVPTHTSHELRANVFDAFFFLKNSIGALVKHLNDILVNPMFGSDYLLVFKTLFLMPINLLSALLLQVADGARLDLLPDLGLKVNKEEFWSLSYFEVGAPSFFHFVASFVVFSLTLVIKCLKLAWWCGNNPGLVEKMFRLSWGGVNRIGDSLLSKPLFTPPTVYLRSIWCPPEPPLYKGGLLGQVTILVSFKLASFFSWLWGVTWTPHPFGDKMRVLGRFRWLEVKNPSHLPMWNFENIKNGLGGFIKRPPLWGEWPDYRQKMDYHWRVVPAWILKLVWPGVYWGYYLPYPDVFHRDWRDHTPLKHGIWSPGFTQTEDYEIKGCPYYPNLSTFSPLFEEPRSAIWISKWLTRGGDYESVYGNSTVKGDFLQWNLYPSRLIFVGTALLWFGKSWATYSFVDPKTLKINHPLNPKKVSLDFLRTSPQDYNAVFIEDLAIKFIKFLFACFVSPVSTLSYYFPLSSFNPSYFLCQIWAACSYKNVPLKTTCEVFQGLTTPPAWGGVGALYQVVGFVFSFF